MTRDASTLVSFIVAASSGVAGHEDEIVLAARHLKERFAFFEIVLLLSDKDEEGSGLMRRLVPIAPQTRLLVVDGAPGFDDLTIYGYQECIGDVVLMASIEELPFLEIDRLVDPILRGARLVRMKRPKNTYLGWLSSRFVRVITGFRVDTRFYRTLALNRQLLTELLAAPERLVLFRFTAGKGIADSKVVVLDRPLLRGGLRSGLRRIDLAARLVMTAAPRLLRYAGTCCALASVAALVALFYVLAIWMMKSDVIEGWTSMTSLGGLWMFVQLGAMSILCLGLSRLLDRNARMPGGRLVDEINVGDLFAEADILNVELVDAPHVTARAAPAEPHRLPAEEDLIE